MKLIIYDCEVFAHDWLVVFKGAITDAKTEAITETSTCADAGAKADAGTTAGKGTTAKPIAGAYAYRIFHNDNAGLREFIQNAYEDTVFIGFNSKHYDQYIIKAICANLCEEDVKAVNDYIIGGGKGYECPLLENFYFKFNNADIRDDMQDGLSLKAIEGHLGMDIRETEVNFGVDRPLNSDELRRTAEYCKHDVDATHELIKLRRDYLNTKLNLAKRAGLDPVQGLCATNARLTAMMLRAIRREWNDGRNYAYPRNLDISVIPRPVLDFFETIHDETIPDETLFKTSLTIRLGGMECKYAWGGVHGSRTRYHERAGAARRIQNRDVSSLYPSLIEKYNYLSRNVPDPELFFTLRRDRIEAKHNGDKRTANDLKLPLNTVSGAQENKYNDLYDPLPTRSMRISGQLFLTVLTMRLLNECNTICLLNLNTDGLMYSVDESEIPTVNRIASEWERETGFELETDELSEVWIKDVNNLLTVSTDEEVKSVGGYLNYGISVKGAWTINNSTIIVKKALREALLHGIPPETTINDCDNLSEFQIIAKAGSQYSTVFQAVRASDGAQAVDNTPIRVPVQRVNRVFATKNERLGTLYKVRKSNGAIAKIGNLPEHCVIANANEITIADVDKQYYIDLAYRRIKDFIDAGHEWKAKPTALNNTKESKRRINTMTTETIMTENTATAPQHESDRLSVHSKLARIREEFRMEGARKSGLNPYDDFRYFELSDIVPPATKLCRKYNCLFLVTFESGEAVGRFIDLDCGEGTVEFRFPMRGITNPVKYRMNEIQSLGAEITYMRRYLYYLLLDICNGDEFDRGCADPNGNDAISSQMPSSGGAKSDMEPSASPKPAKSAHEDPNGTDEPATEQQIRALKAILTKLRRVDPTKDEMIAQIAIQTKGFTKLTTAECERISEALCQMYEALTHGDD